VFSILYRAFGRITMTAHYELPERWPWDALTLPLTEAEAGLARLDERLAKSPVREGWAARNHFADATASVWLTGKLVHLEDLVLRDASMDVRAPTAELAEALDVLRVRRRIAAEAPGWSLSSTGLDRLRGRKTPADPAEADGWFSEAPYEPFGRDVMDDGSAEATDRQLADAIRFADAAMASSTRALASAGQEASRRSSLHPDHGRDEDDRLNRWGRVIVETRELPATLAVAIAVDAWDTIDPLRRQPWLGHLLAADLLRERGKGCMLGCLNIGLKQVGRERRRAREAATRWIAVLEAIGAMAQAGLKEHDRWLAARETLMLKLKGRRSTSRLPALIDLVMSRPIVSTNLIAQELAISPRSAQDLVAELGLRETTGRGRYRAWGVL
jgi:hypothetical protein